jgi:hypothetical protein
MAVQKVDALAYESAESWDNQWADLLGALWAGVWALQLVGAMVDVLAFPRVGVLVDVLVVKWGECWVS